MKRVVVTDWAFDDLDLERGVLAPHGFDLVGAQCRTSAEVIAATAEADAVLTQFAPVDGKAIAAMRHAQVIVRYGIGVDNVDLAAARERGIPVCNIPHYCIDEVADHTLAFMLALTRQVVPNCLRVRGGQWGLAVPVAAMRSLQGAVVGLVGFGRIGRAVARRLAPFGCEVRVFDPMVPAAEVREAGAVPVASVAQLASECDLLSLHCPATAETRGMVDARLLERMKPGALLVNVGRGNLVDSGALLDALESGRLAGAALDVFDPEPIPAGHPILQMPNVIVAAHVASVSPTAVRKLRTTAADLAARRLLGQPLPHIVNGVAV